MSLIADHRPSPTGRWRTLITRFGDPPDAILQALESDSLEDAYDTTCTWINTHVGQHAEIEHLCDGVSEGILDAVAWERKRAQATRTLPPARIGDDPPATIRISSPRPAL